MRSASWLRLAVLLFATLSLVGCNLGPSNNKGKIEGTQWRSAITSFKGVVAGTGKMQFEFRRDGSLFCYVGSQTFSGFYELGSGDIVILKFEKAVQGFKTHHEKIVINGDRMTLTDNAGTLNFERIK